VDILSNINLLTDTLLELRESAMRIASEDDLRKIMDKYNMLFLGKEFNKVYARELHHYMKENLGLSLSLEDFLNLVPDACGTLKMPYEPMVFVKDLNRLADYQITLF